MYLSTALIALMISPWDPARTRSTKTELAKSLLPGSRIKLFTLVLMPGWILGGVTRTISSARSWGILSPEKLEMKDLLL